MENIVEITIVLLGNWNTKIFTPTWIMKELLELDNDELLEIGFNNTLQPIYKYKEIHFVPNDRAFEIKFTNSDDNTIKIANKAALRLINALPFTPNMLIGFNYKYAKNCDLSGIKISDYSDKYSLSEIKFTKEEDDYVLNIIINNIAKQVTYNFHYSKPRFINIKETTIKDHIEYIKNGK